MAIEQHTTRRAILLGAGAFALATPIAVSAAPTGPDAALIADCDEFTRLLDIANASNADATDVEVTRWSVLGDRIIAAPTHTTEGVIARVRPLAAAHGDFGGSFDYPEGEPQMMLRAIMRAVDPAVVVSGEFA